MQTFILRITGDLPIMSPHKIKNAIEYYFTYYRFMVESSKSSFNIEVNEVEKESNSLSTGDYFSINVFDKETGDRSFTDCIFEVIFVENNLVYCKSVYSLYSFNATKKNTIFNLEKMEYTKVSKLFMNSVLADMENGELK